MTPEEELAGSVLGSDSEAVPRSENEAGPAEEIDGATDPARRSEGRDASGDDDENERSDA